MRGSVLPWMVAAFVVVGIGATAVVGQTLGRFHIKNASTGRLEVCINGQYQGYVPTGRTMFTVREKCSTKDGGRTPSNGGKAAAAEQPTNAQDQSDLSFFAWSVGQDGAIRYFRGSLSVWVREIAVVCGTEQLPSEAEIEKGAAILRGSADCQEVERKIEVASELFHGKYKGDDGSADLKLKDGVVSGTITRGEFRSSVRGQLSLDRAVLESTDAKETLRFTATATPTALTFVDASGAFAELKKLALPQLMSARSAAARSIGSKASGRA